MSNRRCPRHQVSPEVSPNGYLDALTGRRIAGGCDDCDAYQVMTKRADGVYVVTISHDDTCFWLNTRTS